MTPKSFTIEYAGLVSSLKTTCGICMAVDPVKLQANAKYPPVTQFITLWDTGAEGSVISKNVIQTLKLESTGKAKVFHAGGESLVNTYSVNILLPNNTVFYVPIATEGNLEGTDALIGMDIISHGDFTITAAHGRTKFTFQIPSTHDTDYVRENNQTIHPPFIKEAIPGRNDSCPCGSGKKYKHCCGNK